MAEGIQGGAVGDAASTSFMQAQNTTRSPMPVDPRLREALLDLFEYRLVHLESPLDALHLLDMIGGHGELRSSTTHWTLTYDPPNGRREGPQRETVQ